MLCKDARNAHKGQESHEPRITITSFKTQNEGIKINVIWCYSPNNDSCENNKYQFYNGLQSITAKCPGNSLNIMWGNLSAKVGMGKTRYEYIIGRHGLIECDEDGDRCSPLCLLNKLYLGGIIFPHKHTHTKLHVLNRIALHRTRKIIFASVKISKGS